MSTLEALWPNMILLHTAGFTRGSARFPNESPVRRVPLSPYLIDRLPVTNAQFARFIAEGGYCTPRFWTKVGWRFVRDHGLQAPNYWADSNWNDPDLPVTGISWWEARAYAAFVGKTLPTEAQWEYAAGLGGRTYPWDDAGPTHEHANFAPGCEPQELRRRGTPVEGLPLNFAASGCRDMAGNVGEWCLDNASNNYEWDRGDPDPLFTTREDDPHVLRGGSGLHDEDALRCASRDYYAPTLRDNITGLRCVVWPLEAPDEDN
jgi:formylglycine-generating enzyme required for sulfatase activity